MSVDALFTPFQLGKLALRSRVVMAPMTRNFSPGGVPGANVAAYYGKRAEHGVGLIITEGMVVAHPTSNGYKDVPRLDPSLPREGLEGIVKAAHAHGVPVFPQLWHVGSIRKPQRESNPDVPSSAPSAVSHPAYGDRGPIPHALSESEIADVARAFATSAGLAREIGFDGVEVHGAHGYLLDQFAWPRTNQRTDAYAAGPRFAAEVVRAIRAATAPDFPIVFRFSQWKLGAYDEVVWWDAAALSKFLGPLVDAGVDVFHPSTRKLLAPAFANEPRSLAAITKQITGKPTIAVGSVGLDVDINASAGGAATAVKPVDDVAARLEAGEFDLLAVGRAILAEPRWPKLVREGALAEATPYSKDLESRLE